MKYEQFGYDAIERHKPWHSTHSYLIIVLPEWKHYEPPPGFGWGIGTTIQPNEDGSGNRIIQELVHLCGSATRIKPAREGK